MNTVLVLEQTGFKQLKYYLLASAFILGNILFPLFCHQFNLAGPMFLPIYFFILIGAYKYGWKIGVVTAVLSPLFNSFLTGMPPVTALPVIVVKGLLLASAASLIAYKTKKISLTNILFVILSYQAAGIVFESIYLMSLNKAMNDVVIGYPGLLVQLVGSYLILRLINNGECKKTDI
jgi:hypothetical protein